MKLNVTARNMAITPAIQERIEKKTDKMSRYLTAETEMNVRLTRLRSGIREAEITVPMGSNVILRTESSAPDNLFLAIDDALSKMERMIRRHRTKLSRHLRETAFDVTVPEYMEEDDAENPDRVVRRKTYAVRPMSVEDAYIQMDLLGHDFFAFVNSDTEKVNVIYRRKDGDLGLLEPEA